MLDDTEGGEQRKSARDEYTHLARMVVQNCIHAVPSAKKAACVDEASETAAVPRPAQGETFVRSDMEGKSRNSIAKKDLYTSTRSMANDGVLVGSRRSHVCFAQRASSAALIQSYTSHKIFS